mgnify:CR=1 FL=1
MNLLKAKLKVTEDDTTITVKGYGEQGGRSVTTFSYLAKPATKDEIIDKTKEVADRLLSILGGGQAPPSTTPPTPIGTNTGPQSKNFTWD